MKIILLISCLSLICLGMVRSHMREKTLEVLAEHIRPCAEENQVLPTEMDKFYDTELQGDERHKFGCLKACVMRRLNALENGQVKVERLRESLEQVYVDTPEKVEGQITTMMECADQVKDVAEDCDLSFEFSRCIALKSDEQF